VEDYDLNLARDLVRGVDIWLNTPRRLQEACGTSGMKASMNGVINLSVRDGWWDEAYNGANGWAIEGFKGGSLEDEDRADAEVLYSLLENSIVPYFMTATEESPWLDTSPKKPLKQSTPIQCL
jgi:starch phosphorylase